MLDYWTARKNIMLKAASQTENHCPLCGVDYAGAECPICAPLQRIQRAVRDRRQRATLRRQCKASFVDRSQPPEKN
jgi:hypothetical protein